MARYRHAVMGALVASMMLFAIPFAAYAQQQQVSVTLDKQSYSTGDTLRVTGKVPRVIAGLDVIIQLMNERNVQAALTQVTPASDGSFSAEFRLGGPMMSNSGTYRVVVTYGDIQSRVEFSFTAQAQPTAREFSVRISGIQENITLRGTMTVGSVRSATIDQDFNSIVLQLSGVNTDGKMTITIPSSVIRDEFRGQFMNVEFIPFSEEADADIPVNVTRHTADEATLEIDVPAGIESLEIVVAPENIAVVPEFGVIAALILAAGIGAFIAVSRRHMVRIFPQMV
ncbi:MAG: PEFG-CTERM sorting domain-containing protein [Candidatus Nitrosocaldus sp.]|nr:PEFG-CTERM sorting domain-containing protein [Candidatus Nitrosocaldus sp.]MDW8274754.1 PEFG-CTERM sorting domain-containing protein [Candidatus Nitrosocaldus sp.]